MREISPSWRDASQALGITQLTLGHAQPCGRREIRSTSVPSASRREFEQG